VQNYAADAETLLSSLLSQFDQLGLVRDRHVLNTQLHQLKVLTRLLSSMSDMKRKFEVIQILFRRTIAERDRCKQLRQKLFTLLHQLSFSQAGTGDVAVLTQADYEARTHYLDAMRGGTGAVMIGQVKGASNALPEHNLLHAARRGLADERLEQAAKVEADSNALAAACASQTAQLHLVTELLQVRRKEKGCRTPNQVIRSQTCSEYMRAEIERKKGSR
jgi:hypothetical protein